MHTFFITGLPRSRTAWLANLFTTGNVFCFHEAPAFVDMKPERFPELFKGRNCEYVGNSDSSVPFYAKQIVEMFPDTKFVYIRGDIEKTVTECSIIFERPMRPAVELCQKLLTEFADTYKPLKVDVDCLDKLNIAKMLWEYCVPTIPFDEQRYIMLRDMDVKLTEKGLDKRRELLCQSGL